MIPDIPKFIDIHTHILPGIDDGPKNLEESAAMARFYVDLGISQIIATPHFIPGTAWAASREKINEKVKEVQNFFSEQNIALQLYPGMEIAYHNNVLNRLEKGLLQSLANSQYYLLEPSFQDSQRNLLQCARQLMEQGLKVILAHPERIKTFQENLEPLHKAITSGLEVQLNSGSILGKFGETCKQTAMQLIAADNVHYLASDAHSADNRKPLDAKEWQHLSDSLGNELLSTLCISNPQKIIQNQYDK